MSSFVGTSAFCILVLLFCELLPSSFLFVQSKNQEKTFEKPSLNEDRRARNLKKNVRREGDWVITEEINKNNFHLDELPELPTITVTDYDQYRDIRVDLRYKGNILLNAWASDLDYDVAPRYVERFSGIKYASIFKRFERSSQAYGYTYTNYNITSDGTSRSREVLLDATTFGPMCIQEGVDEKNMNEDCLYLNLWRPSIYKQSLNTTSKCRHRFMSGGIVKKVCELYETTRTVKADGSIVIETNTNKTNEILRMGKRSLFDEDAHILDERDLQSIGDTLDNALDNLEQGIKDINEELASSSDSEDNYKPNFGSNNDEDRSNLGTYNVDSSGLLPVMVYIHGGGFMQGSGNDPMFDGSKVAGRGQVILITLNYRLGVFGFLPSFGWDQWKVNGGMNGFMDIVEALTWVQRNIKQWGGNPDKVTIFGPSSTPAVCLLTMCPLAAGKFQRAILHTSTRETEVRNGRIVTKNGANGASCLLSSQEPYQPLEGRIEIAYKFFDYINEVYYNFPENPDPTREDIIDWLKAYAMNSTALLNASIAEGTVFYPNRPGASFDYNRDDTITSTQQRRTFMTWDNDIFPQMPIDLERANPIDMMIGVRGRTTNERTPPKTKRVQEQQLPGLVGASYDEANSNILEKLSFEEKENNDNNIFIRQHSEDFNRRLEEDRLGPPPKSNGTGDDDYFDFYAPYYDDDLLFDDDDDEIDQTTICSDYSKDHWPVYWNETVFNATSGNYTTVYNRTKCRFDFSGTTSDQELCTSKQFAEIMARNVRGNVYGYVIDDLEDLHGYQRRRMQDSKQKSYFDSKDRNSIRTGGFFEYDIETLYFFDNFHLGNNRGWRMEEVKIQKELFNRWINFVKTGVPVVTKRTAAKTNRYVKWDPFPKGKVGLDTNRFSTNRDSYTPSYLYMSAGRTGERKKKRKKSRMVSLEELMSHRTLWKYPNNAGNSDICSWVLDEANDYDEDYVDVLLDFNTNTAFEYYVTILATLNPTINYVPDREYIAKLPPTMAPTSVQDFISQSLELELSSSPPSLLDTSIPFVFGFATLLAFG